MRKCVCVCRPDERKGTRVAVSWTSSVCGLSFVHVVVVIVAVSLLLKDVHGRISLDLTLNGY